MQLHELKRNTKSKKKRQIGRGGKRGKTSGRGTKGQNARAGRKKRPELRDIIKKIPKQRGYRFSPVGKKAATVSLATLGKVFSSGGDVTPQTLVKQGVIRKEGVSYPRVKILGDGEISVALLVSGCGVSASAEEKIKKAGGEVKVTSKASEA